MFKLSLKNAVSRKGRLILTALAVIAGTAFLAGVFVLRDTMQGSFDAMFTKAYASTDAFVRSAHVIEGDFGDDQRELLPDTLVTEVGAVPGVSETEAQVDGFAAITFNGKMIGVENGPKFGAAFSGSPRSPFALAEGHGPQSPTEVVIDRASAKQGKIHVGDTVTVTTVVGSRDFTVSGISTFVGNDTTMGVSWAAFQLPTAQEFVANAPGKLAGITVYGDGSVEDSALAQRISAAIGDPNVQVVTGKQLTDENTDAVKEVLGVVTVFLSIFALISLFVGSFIIFNVFSISAAQRTRENALLRAVGASRSQVTRSMFIEALIVGIGGSLLGCLGGLGLAAALVTILKSVGMMPNDTTLTIQPGGFVIAAIVGVIVTLLCAIVPAVRSGRVPPLAALRESAAESTSIGRPRIIAGLVTLALAVVATWIGITADAVWLGLGAALLFVTLSILGPVIAVPFVRWATPVLAKLRPVSGRIAGRNAERNPRRTALAAGALAIVVGLIIAVATVGSSAKASVRDVYSKSFVADFTVSSKQAGIGIPPGVADEIQASGVADALGLSGATVAFRVDGNDQSRQVTVVDPVAAERVLRVDFVDGSFAALTADGMLVSKEKADRDGVKIGDTATVVLRDGQPRQLTVQGIYDSNLFGARIVSRQLFQGTDTALFDFSVFVKARGDLAATQRTLDTIVAKTPIAKLQSRDEYVGEQAKSVDGFLNFIYALLGMSLFIAVVGIVITLLLSVYERRREVGLSRAVGMTRGQVRASVGWESLITAVLGMLLGVVLGIALGWIVYKGLGSQGFTTYALPTGTIVATAIGAVILSAIAAVLPARKAAKANILEAIVTT